MVAAPQIDAHQKQAQEDPDFKVLTQKEKERWVDDNLRTNIQLEVEPDCGTLTFSLDRLLNQVPTEELARALRRRLYESDELLSSNQDTPAVRRAAIMHHLVNLRFDIENVISEDGAMSYLNDVDVIGIESSGSQGELARHLNTNGFTQDQMTRFFASKEN